MPFFYEYELHILSMVHLSSVATVAFPQHASLADLSNEEIERFICEVPSLSGLMNDTSAWKTLRADDIRGPFPCVEHFAVTQGVRNMD
jgi:hypothetical protein